MLFTDFVAVVSTNQGIAAMKKFINDKTIRVCIFFGTLLFFTASFSLLCRAEEPVVTIPDSESLSEQAQALHEVFSLSAVWDKLYQSLRDAFKPTVKRLAGLCALLLICAVSHSFSASVSSRFDDGLVDYIGVLCLSGYTFGIVKKLTDALTSYVERLKEITAVLLPTLLTVSAADGVMTAKTSYGGMAGALFVIELLTEKLILPLITILTVLSICGVMTSSTLNLRGISSSLRTFAVFSVTLAMTAVVTALHYQHVIARAADSVGLRAVRFASASLIPLVGGLVGESVKTVSEALRSVKGITGAAGAAAVLSAFLPPLCAVLIWKAEILFCTCLAKTLHLQREADFLGETNGILNLLNAALFASTIGFSAVICLVADAI